MSLKKSYDSNARFNGKDSLDAKLDIRVARNVGCKFDIYYAYIEKPFGFQQRLIESSILDIQDDAIKSIEYNDSAVSKHLHLISPAEMSFMRMNQPEDCESHDFLKYSRTNMGVFYSMRDYKVVLLKNGLLRNFAEQLNTAHLENKDCFLSKDDIENIYDNLDNWKKDGLAFVTNPGDISVPTKEYGNTGITQFMFDNDMLGTHAQDVGNYIQDFPKKDISKKYIKSFSRIDAVDFYFDNIDYMKSKKGSYINMIRLCGPSERFIVDGNRLMTPKGGAYGIYMDPVAVTVDKLKYQVNM